MYSSAATVTTECDHSIEVNALQLNKEPMLQVIESPDSLFPPPSAEADSSASCLFFKNYYYAKYYIKHLSLPLYTCPSCKTSAFSSKASPTKNCMLNFNSSSYVSTYILKEWNNNNFKRMLWGKNMEVELKMNG